MISANASHLAHRSSIEPQHRISPRSPADRNCCSVGLSPSTSLSLFLCHLPLPRTITLSSTTSRPFTVALEASFLHSDQQASTTPYPFLDIKCTIGHSRNGDVGCRSKIQLLLPNGHSKTSRKTTIQPKAKQSQRQFEHDIFCDQTGLIFPDHPKAAYKVRKGFLLSERKREF